MVYGISCFGMRGGGRVIGVIDSYIPGGPVAIPSEYGFCGSWCRNRYLLLRKLPFLNISELAG